MSGKLVLDAHEVAENAARDVGDIIGPFAEEGVVGLGELSDVLVGDVARGPFGVVVEPEDFLPALLDEDFVVHHHDVSVNNSGFAGLRVGAKAFPQFRKLPARSRLCGLKALPFGLGFVFANRHRRRIHDP